jgi:hypothetical protein
MVVNLHEDERGSISPLIIFYFAIILIIIFLIANVSSTYIARRELISRAESALSIAVQELDEIRYYYGSPLTDFLADKAISAKALRVPIDCADASKSFTQALYSASSYVTSASPYQRMPNEHLQDRSTTENAPWHQLSIESIQCDGFDLSVKLAERHELPFQLRVFGLTNYINRVEVGTASFLLSNEE